MTSYPRPRASVGRTLAMQLKRNLRLRLQFPTVSTGRWNPGSLPMPHPPLSKPVRPHDYGAFGSMTLVHCLVYTITAKKSISTKRSSTKGASFYGTNPGNTKAYIHTISPRKITYGIVYLIVFRIIKPSLPNSPTAVAAMTML